MKKTTARIITASAASVLLVSALCVGSYAALRNSGVIASDEYIGVEKAKEIALSHAGVAAADGWFDDAELDREKGVEVYELEFYADGVEYEYKVNAKTGEVLKARSDYDDDDRRPQSGSSDSSADTTQYIGVDKAKEIALAHAGVSADHARFEDADLDRDDGKVRYELEFYADGVEYEYKVDALTGEVLKYKTEGKPASATPPAEASAPEAPAVTAPVESKKPVSPVENISSDSVTTPESTEAPVPEAPAVPETPAVPEAPAVPETPAVPDAPVYIGIEAAKEIALAHAGVAAADARFQDAEFDRDDGRAVYELDFRSGRYEYEYEIDAKTGKILGSEKEYDD